MGRKPLYTRRRREIGRIYVQYENYQWFDKFMAENQEYCTTTSRAIDYILSHYQTIQPAMLALSDANTDLKKELAEKSAKILALEDIIVMQKQTIALLNSREVSDFTAPPTPKIRSRASSDET